MAAGPNMLAAAKDWARERGAGSIRMSVVNVRDTLIEWNRRRSYESTGEVEPFPYGADRLGQPLRDDLWLVVLVERVAGTTVA